MPTDNEPLMPFSDLLDAMDWEELTAVEAHIERIKAFKLRRMKEQSILQDKWDAEFPNGVNGMRRVFKIETDGLVCYADVPIDKPQTLRHWRAFNINVPVG